MLFPELLSPPYQLLLSLSGCPSSWAGGAPPSHRPAVPWELSGSPAPLPSHLPRGGTGGAQLLPNADEREGRGIGGAAPRQRSLLSFSLPRGGTHRQHIFPPKQCPCINVEGLADQQVRAVEKICPTCLPRESEESFRCLFSVCDLNICSRSPKPKGEQWFLKRQKGRQCEMRQSPLGG